METIRNAPIFNKRDRISILPDPLIHHILSFIDMKYAVPTSILSRRWRYIWTSLPTLNFNAELFYSPVTDNNNGFIDFVDKVLILRDSSNIQRFHLDWQDTSCSKEEGDDIKSRLNNTWILVVVRRNVQELYIKGVSYDILEIPPSVTTCKSLTKLELSMTGDYKEMVLPSSMSLPLLKSLKLDSLIFNDGMLTNMLFSSCPALESLTIECCEFINDVNLNISSLSLKHFQLFSIDEIDCKVRLYAPNLTSFCCVDCISKEYSLQNLCSLITAYIDIYIEDRDQACYTHTLCAEKKELYAQCMMKFLTGLHNVKVLQVGWKFLEVFSRVPEMLDNQSPQFFNLQRLELETWLSRDCMHAIVYLLEISPKIESLSLQIKKLYAANTGENFEAGLSDSVACMLYHLKFVEIRDFFGCDNILKFLESLLKNAVALVELVLFSCTPLLESKEKLLSFPCTSSSVSILFKSY